LLNVSDRLPTFLRDFPTRSQLVRSESDARRS